MEHPEVALKMLAVDARQIVVKDVKALRALLNTAG
jgi:hypothetical protein